jgi:uncharacterized membrane protein YesL
MTIGLENKPSKTWMPTVAGVLCIIAGVITIFVGLWIFKRQEGFLLFARAERWRASGLLALIIGVMSIIGGIFALMRKAWGVALAGAITALYPFGLFGVISIICVCLAKKEFDRPASSEK